MRNFHTTRNAIRLAIGLTLLAILALITSGCGSNSGTTQSASSTGSGADLSGQTAVFTTYGGIVGTYIERFFGNPVAEETGLSITYDAPTEYAKLQTQVETETVQSTVLEGDSWFAGQQCENLLEPIPSTVPLSKVKPEFTSIGCQVPGFTYSFPIVYDKSVFPTNPPTGWSDFFDTSAYPGKRCVWGSYPAAGQLEGALLADGVPRAKIYPLDVERAIDKWKTISSSLVFYETLAQLEQQLVDQQCVMAVTGGNQNGWAATKNGTTTWVPIFDGALRAWDAYITPKGADQAAADAILANILTDKAQVRMLSQMPFGPTLENVKLPAKLASEPLFRAYSDAIPANTDQTLLVDPSYYAKNLEMVTERWTAFVNGE